MYMPAGYATPWPYRFSSRFNSPLLKITFCFHAAWAEPKKHNNHHHSDYASLLNVCSAPEPRRRELFYIRKSARTGVDPFRLFSRG